MGTVLGALGDLGYGFAYRVLDAQFFGVPQRRHRVFNTPGGCGVTTPRPVGKTAALVCALQHADKATTLTILTQATRRDLYSMLIELAHYAQASPPTVVVRQPSTVETRPLPWHQPRHGRPRLDPPIVLDPDAPWTVDDIRRHREILDHYHPITAVTAARVDGDFTPFTPKRALDSPSRDEASAARGAVTATPTNDDTRRSA